MAEYIDKHEAYTLLKDLEAAYIYPPVKEAYAKAARHIDQMEAADVQPVKRGKWIEIAGYGGWSNSEFKCPECGITEYKPTNFCPNCGAELRGIENG